MQALNRASVSHHHSSTTCNSQPPKASALLLFCFQISFHHLLSFTNSQPISVLEKMAARQYLFRGKKKRDRSPQSGPLTEPTDLHMFQHPLANPQLEVESYERVYDNNEHLSKHIDRDPGQLGFRGNWAELRNIYQMISANAEVKQIIDNCGWSRMFSIDTPPRSDHRLVEALIERWWDTTHTFHFPQFEIGITPLDFTLMTGISIGKGDPPHFDYQPYRSCQETIQKYFPELKDSVKGYRSFGISVAVWKPYWRMLSCIGKDGYEGLEVRIARAFLMWVAGNVFFTNGGGTTHVGWLAAFEDLSKVNTYDWGSAILGRLYIALDMSCRRRKSVDGMWQLIEYWYYEYMHTSNLSLRSDVIADTWPRICRWNRDSREKVLDSTRFNLTISRSEVEMTTDTSVKWELFHDTQFLQEPDVDLARTLSFRRVVLYVPEQSNGVWYLGDRCWRQLTGKTALPANPPTQLELTDVPLYVFNHFRSAGWPDAHLYVTIVDEAKYIRYWQYVSVGPLLPPMSQGVSNGRIGVLSPQPLSSYCDTSTCHTQSDEINPPELCNWNVQVAGSAGQTMTIPVPFRTDRHVTRPTTDSHTPAQLLRLFKDRDDFCYQLQKLLLHETTIREQEIARRDVEIAHRDVEIARLDAEISNLRQTGNGLSSRWESLRDEVSRLRDEENQMVHTEK